MTDEPLPWTEPEPMVVIARKPRAHRHVYGVPAFPQPGVLYACLSCGAIKDEAKSKRGRTSLRAGKDAERAVAKAYGGTRTGQFGGPDDVIVGEWAIVQSKAGGWFSERVWSELAKLPRSGGRIPTLIVSERPGHGGVKARRYVVRMMDDDVALHGEKP